MRRSQCEYPSHLIGHQTYHKTNINCVKFLYANLTIGLIHRKKWQKHAVFLKLFEQCITDLISLIVTDSKP